MKSRRKIGMVRLRLAAELAVLGLVLLAAVNYQTLADQYALATFRPTAATAAVIGQLGLTPQARGVLYRAQPQVESAADFNRDCQATPQELELGCYFHGRIYVLEITNQSLAPEMEVAMAHELLHAEWDRYSSSEQAGLGTALEQVYHGLHDPGLEKRMSEYAKTEPGQETNELHSILGTEQTQLPVQLDQHYGRYFSDRSQVTDAHAAYVAVFTNLSDQLNRQLAKIQSQKAVLTDLNAQMSGYRTSGEVAAYNALVPQQNALVDMINNEIGTYSQGVNEYNALAESLNSQVLPTEPTSAP